MCVEKTKSGVSPVFPAYTFQRGPAVALSTGCATAVFSTSHPRSERKPARKSPTAPSWYVVDSISHNWRVSPIGSKGCNLEGSFMMLPEYRSARHRPQDGPCVQT